MSEQLIELVRTEQCLYDTNHPDYMKKSLKDSIWDRISREIKYRDGSSAKAAWMKLRNCHRDSLRKKVIKSGSAARVYKPWQFENQMRFLIKFMTNRPTSSNVSLESLSEQGESSQAATCMENNQIETNIEIIEIETNTEIYNESRYNLESETNEQVNAPRSQNNDADYEIHVQDNTETHEAIIKKNKKASSKKKIYVNELLVKTLKGHEARAKQRRVSSQKHWMMSFVTFLCPCMLVQNATYKPIQIKENNFKAVSNEEEYLLLTDSSNRQKSEIYDSLSYDIPRRTSACSFRNTTSTQTSFFSHSEEDNVFEQTF